VDINPDQLDLGATLLNLVPELAKVTGVPQGTLLLFLFLLVKGANVTARLIPDDATGWKGAVRNVAALIGLYVSSRVTSGVTVTDAAKAAIGVAPAEVKAALEAKAGELRVNGDVTVQGILKNTLSGEGQPVPGVYDPRP
jgi:hypothetical protein